MYWYNVVEYQAHEKIKTGIWALLTDITGTHLRHVPLMCCKYFYTLKVVITPEVPIRA